LNRRWKKDDIISISFDMNPRTLRGMKNPDDAKSEKHIAFIYGPLVLARDEAVCEVGKAVCIGKKTVFTPVDLNGIDSTVAMNVSTGKEALKMIDYASAGKKWGTKFEAWLEVNEAEN